MSLPVFLLVLGATTAVTIVVSILGLWLSCRLFRIEKATLARVGLTYLLIHVVFLPLNAVLYVVAGLVHDEMISLLSGVAALAVMIVVPCVLMRWMLAASYGRAALAWFTSLLPSVAAAFVLTLVWRTTLVEAFVNPTGGMAPALYGAHADTICDECNYAYAVSMSYRISDGPFGPVESIETTCPMCGHTFIVPDDAPVIDGDRMLVDKTLTPKRWDLLVFKYPKNPRQTYVKRLVGLPNEVIEITRGDVYVNAKLLRKSPGELLDLWLPVHDTAYVPQGPQQDGPTWRPTAAESPWQSREGGGWQCRAKDGAVAELEFTQPVEDRFAYNVTIGRLDFDDRVHVLVRDVMIECQLDQVPAAGQFGFIWEFGRRRVTATIASSGDFEILSNEITAVDGPVRTLEPVRGRLEFNASTQSTLAFAYRDGQAYLTADGNVVALLVAEPDDADYRGPLVNELEHSRIAIFSSGDSLAIGRLRLYRDVHYLTEKEVMMMNDGPGPSSLTYHLGPDEYFTLGDNSRQSQDSRFWGAVPSEHVIGIVRWRYWPASRWHAFF